MCPIIGWIEGPMAEACDLTGIEQFMMMQMMNPDIANILLDKCVLTAKEFAKAQIEAGCEIIGIGDAICSQIDPFTYQTFVKEASSGNHKFYSWTRSQSEVTYMWRHISFTTFDD